MIGPANVLARGLLAGVFVVGGINQVKGAHLLADKVEAAKEEYGVVLDVAGEDLVRLNGAGMALAGGALALSGGDLTLCRRAVERGAWPGRGGGRVPPGPVAGCCQAARARVRVSAVLPGPCGGVAHWRGSPPRVDFEFSA